MKNVVGIDEAAKMPVLGAIPVCGVWIDNTNRMNPIKLRDSKILSKKRREELSNLIYSKYFVVIGKITPIEMNKTKASLNELEVLKCLQIINLVLQRNPLENIVVDNFEHDKEGFLRKLRKYRDENWINQFNWIIVHNADKKFKVCSAASIVATNCNDKAQQELDKIYGTGSGNPGDEKTEKFIYDRINELDNWDHIIRLRWKTIERVRQEHLDREDVKNGRETKSGVIF